MTAMERISARLAAGLVLALSHATVGVAQDTVRVAVVATTDIHGRAMHWDYVTDTEAPWGLTRAATIVDSLRRVGPVVLVDAGGMLQGDPLATYFATEGGLGGHPVVDVMSAMRYDAFVVGNHDFDFGIEAFSMAMQAAAFPVLAANVYTVEVNARRAFGDVAVVDRGGVRVGVAGFTTPGATVWNVSQLRGRLDIRPIVPEAEQTLSDLHAAGVDLKVVVLHSGMGEPSTYDPTGIGRENVGAQFAELPVKPDLVVLGHTHRSLVDFRANGVHFMQPRSFAEGVAVAYVTLVRPNESRPFRVTQIESEEVLLGQVPPDPVLTRRLSTPHNVVQTWANEPIGEVNEHWSAQFARAGDTPVIDFINGVQRRRAGAQLSATYAVNTTVAFGHGRVQRRDILGLYPGESRLMSVRIDGRTLRSFLEKSAEYFLTYQAGQPIINPEVLGSDFVIVSGVDYTIDASRAPGSRIRQMVYNGRLVGATDTFTMALGSYRRVGGGGYDMIPSLPVVYDEGERIRDLLMEEIRQRGVLDSASYYVASWRLAPPAASAAVWEWFGPPRLVSRRTAIRVLVTSALRGGIEPETTAWSGGRPVGGALALKGWMDSLEAACNCAAVRIDAGDHLSGGFASDAFFGRPMVDVLNVIGYDAVAVGESEFTWGADTLAERAGQSAYPWLAANLELTDRRARPDWADEWTMVERNGVRIAIIGVTVPGAVSTVLPANMAGLRFSDPAAAVTRVLRTVRNTNPDHVIVVAHGNANCSGDACQDDLLDLARQLESGAVDLLVGDTHGIRVHSVVNGIHVVQVGADAARVGLVDFATGADGRLAIRASVERVWADRTRPDPMMGEVLAQHREERTRLAQRTVANLKFPLSGPPRGESALGRLIGDAYRNAARTHVAVVANERILTGLPAGPLTYGQLAQAHPLSQAIVRMSVSGEVIRSMLEHMLAGDAPTAHVSGLTVWYDPRRRAGDRVRRVRLPNDRELERDEIYTLAVSDFVAAGGGGYDMIAGADVERTNLSGVEALANYLGRLPQPVEMTAVTRFRVDQ
jgi:2',3'-cyclic-nucleotide 2'-phosphodiesterase/3'-nucleotidase